ncbi:tripartite tricarboxylate transporter TctB family protein [Corynebacterium glaucum]|nr:tripartite tricarboxylate transporter TctB family protein [Corynebacterium glaucum]
MSTVVNSSTPANTVRRGALHGRSELVMVGLLLILAAVLIFDASTWEVASTARPGPKFVPFIVAGALVVIAVAYAIDIFRKPIAIQPTVPESATELSVDMLHDLSRYEEASATSSTSEQFHSDWKTLLPVVFSFLAFVLILPYAGWVISAAALFWAIAYFLGSTRPVFDIWIALIVSSSVQLIFGGVLGLNLPAGIFGGL